MIDENRIEIDPTDEQIDRGVSAWLNSNKKKPLMTCIIDEVIIDQLKAIAGK